MTNPVLKNLDICLSIRSIDQNRTVTLAGRVTRAVYDGAALLETNETEE